jgi:hypothetical protein
MCGRKACAIVALLSAIGAASLPAAEHPSGKAVGSTSLRPPPPLDTEAMNAMLRADVDKDGTLTREELEQYDLSLARRFKDVDFDRDGKLTFYEFEKLLGPPQASASSR